MASKSQLQKLFEQAAAALDLDEGVHALVLRFASGELVAWGSGHEDRRSPTELEALDTRASWLVGADEDARRQLEQVLRDVGDRAGVDVRRGHATVTVRLEDGRVRWIEPGRIRVPVSELERDGA